MANGVFVLDRDTSHLVDLDKDAWLIKFEGSRNIHFALLKDYKLPSIIRFDAVFETLNQTDFPINDVVWPIMSRRMLNTLLDIEQFPHRAIPVVMENCRVISYQNDKPVKSAEENNDFVIVQLLNHLEVFNWEKSVYEVDPSFPDCLESIDKLVLNEPSRGFPPLFRISASPTPLFISEKAFIAFQENNIKGLKFIKIEEFWL